MLTASFDFGGFLKTDSNQRMCRTVFYDHMGAHKKVQIGTINEYPTKAAAERAAEYLRALANPDDPRVFKLSTVVEHYRKEELPRRASTRTFYLPWINNYIQPKWGDYEMRRIQPFTVEQWLKQLDLAPKSKSHIRSCGFYSIVRCSMDSFRWPKTR
jgi:hypothetical protein